MRSSGQQTAEKEKQSRRRNVAQASDVRSLCLQTDFYDFLCTAQHSGLNPTECWSAAVWDQITKLIEFKIDLSDLPLSVSRNACKFRKGRSAPKYLPVTRPLPMGSCQAWWQYGTPFPGAHHLQEGPYTNNTNYKTEYHLKVELH